MVESGADDMTAEQERAAVVAWLRLPRKSRSASFSLRLTLALLGLFRPNLLVQWMNEAVAESIEESAHLRREALG